MVIDEYMQLANRTINKKLSVDQIKQHALFEMCGELGEIHSFFQKEFQGHKIDEHDLKLEVGDLMWGIAELCYVYGWSLEEVAEMNIEKLKRRYPDGFSEERSVKRKEFEE